MEKILPWEKLKARLESLKKAGKRIVFTNGCFDIIHVGHVSYLEKAKELGDVLVVGLNSDASVASLKGPSRPIVPEQERAYVVSALESIDYVTIFEEDTPQKLIEYLKPHILVKGGDWSPDELAGRDVVEKVIIIPMIEGASTTDTISRIETRVRNKE